MRVLFVFVMLLPLVACTKQEMAKSLGGTTVLDLPTCEKLVNVTWKDAELWYLSRPFHEGEIAETYSFKEDSSYGLLEGKVTIKETCNK